MVGFWSSSLSPSPLAIDLGITNGTTFDIDVLVTDYVSSFAKTIVGESLFATTYYLLITPSELSKGS